MLVAPLVFRALRLDGGSIPPISTMRSRQLSAVAAHRLISGCACGPTGVSGAASAFMGRAAVCAGGRRPAREIATREPDGSEWSISRPALALPPPTGTAAWPFGPSGALHPCGVWCADVRFGASARCPASARVLTSVCALRSLRRPSPLWGRGAGVWLDALSWYPARPWHRPRAPQPGPFHPAGLASSGDFPHS